MNGDGSWKATVRDHEKIRRAVRMMDGARAVEIERGEKLNASVQKERLFSEDGRSRSVPIEMAEMVAKRSGLKPKRHYGRPKERWVVRGGEMVRVF